MFARRETNNRANGKNTKWYQSDGQNRKYIPKSNRTLAEQLALRKYLSLVLEELLQEKTAISFYNRHRSIESKSALLLQDSSLGYSELLSPYFQVPPSHTAWLQENYDAFQESGKSHLQNRKRNSCTLKIGGFDCNVTLYK